MEIRLAKKSDLDGINQLFTEVIKDLKTNKKIIFYLFIII